ncbi:uncharacterized protein LOC107264954 isoform X2 [Cephus cinctus]|uniref:Uncharacterized protein LOC107264954 isoform X2 n=1 Tax=Cephus cinctus TaxID=211228 RepID=A0AAJ7BM01_CEPCN|nr:uncharacterized protein LOC107264954 isoform X2 [Cephus cinctus]
MDKHSARTLFVVFLCLVSALGKPLGEEQEKIQQNTDGLRKIRSIYAYGMPLKKLQNNGEIEREVLKMTPKNSPTPASISRITRSIPKAEANILEDLEAQEAKVFRPLFVYRQQVADRYRINRARNPIYGAYQYGRRFRRQQPVQYRH